MRVPTRLPKRLADYVSSMERDGAKLIAASMSRTRGRALSALPLHSHMSGFLPTS